MHRRLIGEIGLTLLALAVCAPAVPADYPMLAIRLNTGESGMHSVEEIECIALPAEGGLAVRHSGRSTFYELADIQRLEFLWGFSSYDPSPSRPRRERITFLRICPAPFRAGACVQLDLPRPGTLELAVFDVEGRRAATLADGYRPAGPLAIPWDGCDQSGRRLSGGLYQLRLVCGPHRESRKTILLPR